MWDLKLLKAHHFIKDFTVDGIPVWWDDSPRVFYDVERRVSRSKAAVQRAEKADSERENSKDVPGRYYVPVPVTRDGSPMPTFAEWAEENAAKKAKS